MSQEKYKNYYIGSKSESVKLFNEYNDTICSKRDIVLQAMLDDTGAIAWREQGCWGEDPKVSDLVFEDSHPNTDLPYVKITDRTIYDDKRVICLRGKLNSKEGREFNKYIDRTNNELKNLPSFSKWIIDRFNLSLNGIGGTHQSGRGSALLSSSAGCKNECVVVTIPNTECGDVKNVPDVPSFLNKVTYGQFYDFING